MNNGPAHIQSFLDNKIPMLLIVDEVLNEWKGEGCYQFPALLGEIKLRMNWDDKQLRANDPIIREYIRNHSDWYVTRGAGGGIMRSTDKQKKDAVKIAKEKVKAELNAALDAEVARKKAEALAAQTVPSTDTVADNTNIVTE
jgi:hypothetical protein